MVLLVARRLCMQCLQLSGAYGAAIWQGISNKAKGSPRRWSATSAPGGNLYTRCLASAEPLLTAPRAKCSAFLKNIEDESFRRYVPQARNLQERFSVSVQAVQCELRKMLFSV